jgi:exopolysaccharide transport family protein
MAHIGETELDVHALATALWRRAWLLVLLAVIAAVGTYVGLGFVEPLYTADAGILIEERESPLTRPDQGADSVDLDESAIQSQVEVLRSREIADAVIDRLDLASRPEFDPARNPSILRSLLVMLGLGEHPAETTIRQRVMDAYFERLTVYPLQKSRVIGVEFSAPNPTLAADVANAVADAFVDLQQDAKRQSAVAATAWLEQEIERLRREVAAAEQAVADYRASHQLFDVDRSIDGSNLSTQQLGELNAELARARAARAEAEARAELVQSLLDEGGAIDASEEVLSSQLIQRLRERQGALRAQVAELSTTLLPAHPRIRALEGQVANLEIQIRSEAEKVLASLQTAARVAAAREESLVASLNEAKVDVSRSNDQEIQLRALEREAAAQRELLESFLARYREAAARTDSNYLPADARIISRAVAPRDPSFPKKAMLSVAVAIAVLLVASAVILLREFLSGSAFRIIGYGMPIGAVHQAELVSPVPLIESEAVDVVHAEVKPPSEPFPEPEPTSEPDMATPMGEEAPAKEQPEAVAIAADTEGDRHGTAELAEILANSVVRVALFAGADGGEGAGEIAYSAARAATREKLRCVVIDVGKAPSKALGQERPGLGDLLLGDAAFGEVIRRDEDSGVHVIPLGATKGAPPLQRLQIVINALSHTYDKVIVVADKLDDWPNDHVRPDVAAIVCGPQTTELLRTEVYDAALARGARSAIIVRYTGDSDAGSNEESEAA